METLIKTLMEKINGKEVEYIRHDSEASLRMDVLLICPPDGGTVSVKPYGYTPAQVADILEKGGIEGYTARETGDPSFCLATHPTTPEFIETLKELAKIPVGGVYCFDFVTANGSDGKAPYCPHG